MSAIDRVRIVRETYGAYESGDREVAEKHLAEDFRFYSPADVGIDLSTYWTRCWTNTEMIAGQSGRVVVLPSQRGRASRSVRAVLLLGARGTSSTDAYACARSSSAEGTTIGPSDGWVKRIGFPNGSRSAQSVP
ncbi:MAG: hypothetical protein JWN10_2915 [Solirubrobacterales bacterium]|nr:hypothetical protein [Solirubrobacterales bacterium]